MAEYIEKEQALMQLTGSFPEDMSLEKYIGLVNFRINKLAPEDVIERAEYKKVLQDCRTVHDENNELIAGFSSLDAKYAKLYEGINKAIEEIKKERKRGWWKSEFCCGLELAEEILRRNIGE